MRFGALIAVNGVSFDAQRGSITVGDRPERRGQEHPVQPDQRRHPAERRQRALRRRRPDRRARPTACCAAGLARSFQITNLFFELPVRENLRLAAQFARGRARAVARRRRTAARRWRGSTS